MSKDIALLDDLLTRMLAAGLIDLDIETDGRRIRMRLGNGSALSDAGEPVAVLSSGIGQFRAAHPRRPGSSISLGDTVQAGATLGYLQSGPTLLAIAAPMAGTMTEILATDGDTVGFGDRVFMIKGRS